jgi:hypothetical protein
MWGKPTNLILCQASTLQIWLNIGPTKGRKEIVVPLAEMTAVEGSVDLSVFVTILFEDVPQKHQQPQLVIITESFGSVHQHRDHGLFVG